MNKNQVGAFLSTESTHSLATSKIEFHSHLPNRAWRCGHSLGHSYPQWPPPPSKNLATKKLREYFSFQEYTFGAKQLVYVVCWSSQGISIQITFMEMHFKTNFQQLLHLYVQWQQCRPACLSTRPRWTQPTREAHSKEAAGEDAGAGMLRRRWRMQRRQSDKWLRTWATGLPATGTPGRRGHAGPCCWHPLAIRPVSLVTVHQIGSAH